MKMGLFSAVIIIVILEVLRYFRESRRAISEIDELKSRIQYLEDKLKEK